MQTFYYDVLDSTNNEAKRLIEAGKAENGSCVIARTQTGGRGTQGRTWISPEDAGVYFSLVHFPEDCPVPEENLWTMIAGIACCEALKGLYPKLPVRIKPINDLYIEDKKLGGILTEAVIHQGKLQSVITGIGINLFEVQRTIEDNRVEPTSLSSWVSSSERENIDPKTIVEVIRKRLNPMVAKPQLLDKLLVKTEYEQWLT